MSNIELIEKTLPVAPLKIAAMESCIELGQKVNDTSSLSVRTRSMR